MNYKELLEMTPEGKGFIVCLSAALPTSFQKDQLATCHDAPGRLDDLDVWRDSKWETILLLILY